jgi:hypothetical protein
MQQIRIIAYQVSKIIALRLKNTSAQAVPVTVLLQDAMPHVLMNAHPETQPTPYYQS